MDCIKLLRTIQNHPFTYLLYEEAFADRKGYTVAILGKENQFAYATDVTDDQDVAERFIKLISEGGLAPCHLHDVLEDMLPLS
ncbi:MAG: hypothetical protein J6R82_00475 [Clostridia bacterium]|nr:hypothetical protein [Clostridia bacterium]